MKFKHKAGHFAGLLALSAAVYLPQANATTLGVPSPAPGDSFNIYNVVTGGFTDYYNFSVNSDANFSFSGSATDVVGTGIFSVATNGATFSDVYLYDTTTSTKTETFLGSTLTPTVVDPSDTLTVTTYSATLGGVVLSKNDSYELVFTGNSENVHSKVSGTIFLSAATGVSAVPLPSATWLFLTGLMGFLGLSRSRKAA